MLPGVTRHSRRRDIGRNLELLVLPPAVRFTRLQLAVVFYKR